MYSSITSENGVVCPDFWDNFTRQVHINWAKQEGITLLTAEQHSEFLTSVAKMAEKSGLLDVKSNSIKGYLPHIMIMDEIPIGAAWARKMPNAAANHMRGIIISKSMLDLTNSSIHRAITPELEAVMAHEFSHLKDGSMHMLMIHRGTFALPLVAMAGLYLYDRAKEKTKREYGQSKDEYLSELSKNIHKSADEEIEKGKNIQNQQEWHFDSYWKAGIINAGRYGIVAAVGLVGGLLAARHASLAAEFRADKNAVELTGNPEIFKKVLSELTNVKRKYLPDVRPKADNFGEIIKEKYHWLMARTLHAHPTLDERLSHIDRVAGSTGFAAGRG